MLGIKKLLYFFFKRSQAHTTHRLQKGDHIYCYGIYGTYTHHGLYVGNSKVIHYAGLAKRFCAAPIEIVSLKEFSLGRTIYLKEYSPQQRKFTRDEIAQRALDRVGENYYSIVNNNCEHFVRWCITGKHKSRQFNRIFFALNTNIALVFINSSLGEISSSLTAVEIFRNNLTSAVLFILLLVLTLQFAITFVNRFLLRHQVGHGLVEVKARHLGKTIASFTGLFVTCFMVLLVHSSGNNVGLSDNALFSGITSIGNWFCGSANFTIGILFCVTFPFMVITLTGWLSYHFFRYRLARG